MKTIKIIDLLNKIANGEEVPKKIKYKNKVFIYDQQNKLYRNEEVSSNTLKHMFYLYYLEKILNDEVEIIEYVEKDKGIKKVDTNIPCSYEIETTLRDKLNEVIDIVNSLNKKEGK